MSNLAYKESYTIKDYRQWKGDWELIYGNAYAMAPSPVYSHQYTNLKIARWLDEKLENCSHCHTVLETDWYIDNETVVRPDSAVVCYEPKDYLTKKPEIIFEVISNSTAKRDEILKFELYQKEGVKYYILVYPEMKKAKVYTLIDYNYKKVGDFYDERFVFHLKNCDIEFDFNFIWKK